MNNTINPQYYTGGISLKGVSNNTYRLQVENIVNTTLAEKKVEIYTDMLNAKDITSDQKSVILQLLNDAKVELANYQRALNIG